MHKNVARFIGRNDADMTFHNSFSIHRLLFLTALFVMPVLSYAQAHRNSIANPMAALKKASTPSDSIRILLDAYNISDKINRDNLRMQLINLAQRSDNHEVIEDVLKELAGSTDDTGELARLIEISETLPEDSAKENLKTVLVMEQAKAEASTVADSDISNQVAQYAYEGLVVTGNPYKEIQNIYRAMMYLGASSQGPLYFEYIKRLEELVENLPEEDHDIKNLYYTTASIFYTRKRDYKKAVEFDRKLIDQLNKIKAHYKDPEKAARDLNYFYYVSYRRMLRNFRALTPEEIEEVYRNCVELAKIDEKAAKEFGSGGLTNSYYFMATKQYDKAVPELKKALSQENISTFRRQELLGHLGYALRKTGDKEGELETLRTYAHMLYMERAQRRDDMYKEIELRNSVNKIIADEYLAQAKQREDNRVMRKVSITLVYVLAVILIFVCQAYFRLRGKVKDLEMRNSKLHRNIEYIFDDGVPKGTKDIRHHKNRLK